MGGWEYHSTHEAVRLYAVVAQPHGKRANAEQSHAEHDHELLLEDTVRNDLDDARP